MKKIILALICLFCFNVTCFANEQEVINSFKKLVNELCIHEQATYGVRVSYISYKNGKGYWSKYQKTNLKTEIDIQKTNSIISPYKGIVILRNDIIDYCSNDNPKGQYATKEEAEKADMQWYKRAKCEYRYIYIYQNNEWQLESFKIIDI